MKTRDSGMPDEASWERFFDPEQALLKLHFTTTNANIVEFGCGYGTFTIPAARLTQGIVYALDIEPQMIAVTQAKAAEARLANVRPILRDFAANGTGLEAGSSGYAMLFNILHAESPLALLREANRVLEIGGVLGIMHRSEERRVGKEC
jgi:ubiquinone/menaquinone biosynthesis C-methylase UbiE